MVSFLLLAAGHGRYLWPMDLEIWSGVIFVVLASILVVAAGKPIVVAARGRQESILHELKQAAIAEAEVNDLLQKHEQEKAKLRERAKELIAEAHRDATATKAELLARAEAESTRLSNRVRREIGLLEQKAVSEIWSLASTLSLKTAEKAARTQLSTSDQERLLDEALADLAKLEVAS